MENQNNNIENSLIKIKDKTTVAKIENFEGKVIYKNNIIIKNPYLDREDCPELEYREQIELQDLKKYWNNKWNFFNNEWSKKRQLCRYLYDSFNLFYYSFYQLRKNKKELFMPGGKSIRMSTQECNLIEQLISVNLFGVYMHGKKCIDLAKELNLLVFLNEQEKEFIGKFSTTRNWLFEHNFKPDYGKSQLNLEPLICSMKSSANCLQVNVHSGESENMYKLIFFYEDDYFNLELIFKKIFELFNNEFLIFMYNECQNKFKDNNCS